MWPLTQGRQSPLFPGAVVAHRTLGGIRNQGAESILGSLHPASLASAPSPPTAPSPTDPVSICGHHHAVWGGGTSVSPTATAAAEALGT